MTGERSGYAMNVQKIKLASWLTWAILAAMTVVIAFGFLAFQNVVRIQAGEASVAQSHDAREVAQNLLSSIKGMETGHRGFLLTNDDSFLEPYNSGLVNIEDQSIRLKSLVSSATQQNRLKRIDALIEQKKSFLAEKIAHHTKLGETNPPNSEQAEHSKAMDTLLSGRGKTLIENIQSEVSALLEEEAERLTVREAEAKTRASSSKQMIVAGNLLALALLLTSGFVARLDRKKRDETRAELEEVFNSTSQGIITFDERLQIRMVNPAAAQIHRIERDSAVGQSFTRMIPERRQDSSVAFLHDFIKSEENVKQYRGEIACRFDGSEFPFDGVLHKLTVNSKPLLTLMLHDLTQQYSAAEKILEQTEILEQVRDAIFVCDLDDKITFWNKGAKRLFGVEESDALGKDVSQLLFCNQPEAWSAGKPVLAKHGTYTGDITMIGTEGKTNIITQRRSLLHDWQQTVVAQLVFNTDVTERKKREANERRAQRIESIGTLAGGIAHDFNNLLTPILMNAKLLKRGHGDSEKLAGSIVLAAQRGSELIARLLAFAGGGQIASEKIEVKEIIGEAHEILQHALPKTIELKMECENLLHPIAGDPTELSQVIMNLAINARDAMPEGGRLDLKARNFHVDRRRAKRSDNLNAGPHVLLTVSDEGSGIKDDIIDKIFDPFFTTKEQGKGTGLGLATSLGIVRRHGGEISVYSEVGSGTNFSVLLPAATTFESEKLIVEHRAVERGHGETILLVDDEIVILEAARATLEANGYRVFTATGGAEAIARLQHDESGVVDLVLVDVMMPGLDGVQTRDGIRAFNQDIPIIASSGLRRPGQKNSKELESFDAFLSKPYTDEQLLQVILSGLKK